MSLGMKKVQCAQPFLPEKRPVHSVLDNVHVNGIYLSLALIRQIQSMVYID